MGSGVFKIPAHSFKVVLVGVRTPRGLRFSGTYILFSFNDHERPQSQPHQIRNPLMKSHPWKAVGVSDCNSPSTPGKSDFVAVSTCPRLSRGRRSILFPRFLPLRHQSLSLVSLFLSFFLLFFFPPSFTFLSLSLRFSFLSIEDFLCPSWSFSPSPSLSVLSLLLFFFSFFSFSGMKMEQK